MSPEPKEPEQKKALKSVEELAAAQRAHEEKVQAERRGKEEEEAARKTGEAQAGGEYIRRKEAMGEYDTLREDVMKAEAAGIKERMAEAEKLKESELAKDSELQDAEVELTSIKEYLSQISLLVEGKEEEEIAQEVREAMQGVKVREAEVTQKMRGIGQEIKKIRADQISPEQLTRYQEAKAKMHGLIDEIHRLDSNPFVRERFLNEAKGEREMRDNVIREAKSLARAWGDTPQGELVEKVCNSFLSEEFKARGIDAMTNSEERLRTMRELTNDILAGMHGGVDGDVEHIRRVPDKKTRSNQYAGVVLKNFIGAHGTVDGTLGFLIMAEQDASSYQDFEAGKQAINTGLQKHLGTINLIRSYSSGLKDYDLKREMVGRFADWRSFDSSRQFLNSDFIATGDGPIIPRRPEVGVKEIITKEFNKNHQKVQGLETALIKKEREELEKRIPELEKQISEKEALIQEVKQAEDRKYEEDKRYGNDSLKLGGLPEARNKVDFLTRDLENLESNLANLGAFSFRKKKQLRGEIEGKHRELRKSKFSLADFEEREKLYKEAGEIMRKEGPSHKIQSDLTGLRGRMHNLKERIEKLKI